MNPNPYQPGAEESQHRAEWANSHIEAAERKEGAYRASRETGEKSWHWTDLVSTYVPVAIAVIFLLLMLFWVVRLIVS